VNKKKSVRTQSKKTRHRAFITAHIHQVGIENSKN